MTTDMQVLIDSWRKIAAALRADDSDTTHSNRDLAEVYEGNADALAALSSPEALRAVPQERSSGANTIVVTLTVPAWVRFDASQNKHGRIGEAARQTAVYGLDLDDSQVAVSVVAKQEAAGAALSSPVTSQSSEVEQLKAELVARDLRIVTMQESIDGCARRVAELRQRLTPQPSAGATREPRETCSDCGGSGRADRETCPQCGGSGKMRSEVAVAGATHAGLVERLQEAWIAGYEDKSSTQDEMQAHMVDECAEIAKRTASGTAQEDYKRRPARECSGLSASHNWTASTTEQGVRRCYLCGASEPARGSCLICGHDRVFAVYHENGLIGVCAECRDRATSTVTGQEERERVVFVEGWRTGWDAGKAAGNEVPSLEQAASSWDRWQWEERHRAPSVGPSPRNPDSAPVE